MLADYLVDAQAARDKATAAGRPVVITPKWCREVTGCSAGTSVTLSGQTVAALLYLKQAPLTPASANVGVRIMHQSMTTVLPGAEAVVIDVRRGRLFRLRRNQGVSSLDSWIASEAVGYVFHWNGRLASSATGASVHPGQGPCRSGLSVIATAAERPQRAA